MASLPKFSHYRHLFELKKNKKIARSAGQTLSRMDPSADDERTTLDDSDTGILRDATMMQSSLLRLHSPRISLGARDTTEE